MGSALGIIAMTFSNHAFAFSCESSFARQIGVPRQAGAFSTALAMQDQHNEESPRMKPVSVSGSEINGDANRRGFLSQTSKGVLLGMGGATAGWNPIGPPSASANPSTQSRTTGYKVQQTEAEWKEMLSPLQYNILRDGGTESPFTSILESEKREGTFVCAGCGTPLFASQDKFNSGTGWPSFARGLGDGVEVQQVNAIQKNLGGAELRYEDFGDCMCGFECLLVLRFLLLLMIITQIQDHLTRFFLLFLRSVIV